MNNNIILPKWLDEYIYNELGATYCRSNSDMTVIDWNKSQILNYLGTYFPRSFAESITIFTQYFSQNPSVFLSTNRISMLDFGCGTGGEIIGFLYALTNCRPNVNEVEIFAFDGNSEALKLYEKVLEKTRNVIQLNIISRIIPCQIDDFYDLNIVNEVLGNIRFDIIVTFKAICEFVSKSSFEGYNPYRKFCEDFIPKLKEDGLMLLVDVTSFNDVSHEWLPKMIDKGIDESKCRVIHKNAGFNETYTITHSKIGVDYSKVAWRIIKK